MIYFWVLRVHEIGKLFEWNNWRGLNLNRYYGHFSAVRYIISMAAEPIVYVTAWEIDGR